MMLDLLPYKRPQKPRRTKLCALRYAMLVCSPALVSGLLLMKVASLEQVMLQLFLAGNALYYIADIALAFSSRQGAEQGAVPGSTTSDTGPNSL